MYKKILPLLILLSIISLSTKAAATETYQNTDLILSYTNRAESDPVLGTGTSDEDAFSARFEHFGVHDYGDNYFFFESINGDQVAGPASGSFGSDTDQHYQFVWNARASLSKISGNTLNIGPINDVSLFYRMERASYANYEANMIGPSFNLDVPGFTWFQTSLLMNKQNYLGASTKDKEAHLYWHTFGVIPFEIGKMKLTFSPLVWVNFTKGDVGKELYIEPDIWLKIEESSFDIGFRALYHKYDNYSRTTPTLIARWNF